MLQRDALESGRVVCNVGSGTPSRVWVSRAHDRGAEFKERCVDEACMRLFRETYLVPRYLLTISSVRMREWLIGSVVWI